MAPQKRSRPSPGGPSPGTSRDSQSRGTAFRKSAKKARTDAQQPQPPSPKPKPKPPQRTRPKDQPKPKTKHDFIKAKQDAARKEKQAAQAALESELRRKQKDKASLKAAAKNNAAGPAKLIITPPPPTSSFHLIAGSYERILYGLVGTIQPSLSDPSSSSSSSTPSSSFSVHLKPVFTFPAHVSSIRTVATAGVTSKWLATGGTDEVVKVWDLRRRREVGQLTGHEGTITSLTFASKTYLLTTSADSNINLYRTSDWALLRTLKGHIGRINSAAPHPSGRLALSVGSDRTIRMWDLMRGRAAGSTKIGIEADLVRWDSRGRRFAVLAYRQAMIFKTDMTKIAEVEDRKRIGDIQFARVKAGAGEREEHELLFVTLEDGVVKVYDLDAEVKVEGNASKKGEKKDEEHDEEAEDQEQDVAPLALVGKLVGHKNRVKAISILPVLAPTPAAPQKGKSKATATPSSTWTASTISSDGLVRVFDLTPIAANLSTSTSAAAKTAEEYESTAVSVECVGSFDTKGTRLTCLSTVGIPDGPAKNGAEEGEEDDGDADGVVIESDHDVSEREGVEGDEDDEDEEDGEVDEAAEDEELRRLEEAIKEAQAQGLKMEDLEELLLAADAEGSEDDEGGSGEDEDADDGLESDEEIGEEEVEEDEDKDDEEA